jgi:SEC-C motif-containing protein
MTQKNKGADAPTALKNDPEAAKLRLAQTGRNDACPCGSGKKYKKCHLGEDEAAATPPAAPPDPQEIIANGWRLFEQRRSASSPICRRRWWASAWPACRAATTTAPAPS